MTIRKVISRSIEDATIAAADIANNTITNAQIADSSQGGGFYQGENGNAGNTSSGKEDIFRVNETTLNTSVTIASGDNASCAATFDCINIWNCKPYSQWKSYDCIGDKEWVQH